MPQNPKTPKPQNPASVNKKLLTLFFNMKNDVVIKSKNIIK